MDTVLYSNRYITPTLRLLDGIGPIYQIYSGESGRGRRVIALTCAKNTILRDGMNPYAIGTTNSKKWRLDLSPYCPSLYMLLSSQGNGSTTTGKNGIIQVLKSQKNQFHVLSKGNGAYGEAGRVGHWDCVLMQAPTTNAIVRVRNYGNSTSELYVIHNSKVISCTFETLEETCLQLCIEVPCAISENSNDWVTV